MFLPSFTVPFHPAAGGGGGSWTQVQYKTNSGASSSSLSVSMTSTPTNGNLLVLIAVSSTGTLTLPAGWTEIESGNTTHKMAYKIASSESGSYSFTYSGSAKADGCCAIIAEFSGNISSPYDAHGSATSTTTAPSITTAYASELVIIGAAGRGYTAFATAPSGFTSVARVGTGVSPNKACAMAYKTQASAGATGTAVWPDSAVKAFMSSFRSV